VNQDDEARLGRVPDLPHEVAAASKLVAELRRVVDDRESASSLTPHP
jgi:hypothetical protein